MRKFFENLWAALWLAAKTFRTVWFYLRNSDPGSPALEVSIKVTPLEEEETI